ncbi:MAG TPA: glycosyltransferase [bacterium]|nr:glycosyltransferase [bacterium]HPN93119.1 glycosyltransferase [bacterium]
MTVVLHNIREWLPQTMVWVFNQTSNLPGDITNHIVCESKANLGQFPAGNIYSLSEANLIRYFWDKGLRKLGVRRHLGFTVNASKRIKPDIMHTHFGAYGWSSAPAARKSGTRHVVSFYGADACLYPSSQPIWRERYNELFRSADMILCEGPYMAGTLESLGCPREKIVVNRLGVDVSKIRFEHRTWKPGAPLKVLISATFREKKGVPLALEALSYLKNDIPLEITVIGDATIEERSIREKAKILSVIEDRGLSKSVRMLGFQPYSELMREARYHHVFLSPSVTAEDGDAEGGAPVSLIDMAATGLILVSSRHCDIPEIVIHGETGLLSAERDVEGIAANIRWLAENPGEWQRIAAAARARVEKEFDAKTQAEKLAAIYRRVVHW